MASVLSIFVDLGTARFRYGDCTTIMPAIHLLIKGKVQGVYYRASAKEVADRLHLSGAIDAGQLHVLLVPRNPVATEAQISIGRISVFRQSN